LRFSIRGKRVVPFLQTAGVTYGGNALSVVSAPLLAHAVGADGRGVLAGAFVLLQLLSWVSFLGLPRGLALQRIKREFVSGAGILVVFALGFLSAAVAFFLAGPVSNGDQRIELGIRISAFVLIPYGIQLLGAELSLFEGKIWIYNMIRSAVLILPSLAYIVAFFMHALTLESAYLITLMGQVVSVLIGCGFSLSIIRKSRRIAVPWNFSLKYWVTSALDSVGVRVDQLSLSALSTSSVLGVYAVAVSCASASGGLTQALNTLAYSSLTQISGQESNAFVRRRATLGLISSVLSGGAICLIVALLGGKIFGPSFDGLTEIVIVLVVAQIVSDQWDLRSIADSAQEAPSILVVASGAGLLALILVIVGLFVAGVLTGLTMAGAMVIYSCIRIGSRALLRRRKTANTLAMSR
jgi:O-antigen/teichoic acid export membrane protein